MKDSTADSRMSGDIAIVTAAGQGIGRAIAVAMAREGARVIAADLQPDKLEDLASEADCHTLDVTDAEAVERFSRDVPTPTVLVNGVGWVHHGSVLDCSRVVESHSSPLSTSPRPSESPPLSNRMPKLARFSATKKEPGSEGDGYEVSSSSGRCGVDQRYSEIRSSSSVSTV